MKLHKKVKKEYFTSSRFFACVSAIGVICRSLSYIPFADCVISAKKIVVVYFYNAHNADDDNNNNDGVDDDDVMSGHRMSNSGAVVVSFHAFATFINVCLFFLFVHRT